EQRVEERAGRRRQRVRRRMSRRVAAPRVVSIAVGSQLGGLRRFAALQRFLWRSAHGAAHTLRRDRGGVVRRRERRRYEWAKAILRLAAILGDGAATAAECGDLLRRRSGYSLDRQRARPRERDELVASRSVSRAVSRCERRRG